MPRRLLPLLVLASASLAARGGAFRYAEDQAPAIVNPLFATTMSEARLNELVFEGLFADDQDLAATPLLAEGAEVDEDHLGMTVHLRRGVTWHDGEPFTAEDVVFTVEAMKDRRTASTEAGRVDWIREVEALDDHTVRIEFEHPEATPQEKLYFKILPAHRFQGTAVKRSDPFRTSPVGTGPYRLVRFNDDNSITLQAWEGYRGEIGLPDVVMREVSDKSYQAKLLLYESLEALVRVLPRDLATLENQRNVELYPYQTNSWWYLGFNLEREPFDDVRVRRAINEFIDVQALLAPIGTGEVLSGPFVKSSPFYNHDVEPWGYNPMEAAALLQEAGWERVGDRWEKDGRPLTFRVSAHKTLESSQEVVINLQSQLRSHGIDVEVDFLDEARWKARVWRERDFDVILSQWSFDRNEDVREQFHSEGARNFTGYANPKVDELLDRARDATDPQDKKLALRELHRVVHDDVPMVFLWTLDSYSAMSTRVRNVVIHPFYFFTWIRDWRME